MRNIINRVFGSAWLFWALLTLPLFWLLYKRFVLHVPATFFYWTGVLSVWLMLAALAVTPLIWMFRGAGWTRWLVKWRRYLGVASFAYGMLHTLRWLQQAPLRRIFESFIEPLILFGWIGLFIFLAMAVTSNDWSVRRMGPSWKSLQRWVYLAAPLILLHWFMAVSYRWDTVAIYGGMFGLLMLLRLLMKRMRSQQRNTL